MCKGGLDAQKEGKNCTMPNDTSLIIEITSLSPQINSNDLQLIYYTENISMYDSERYPCTNCTFFILKCCDKTSTTHFEGMICNFNGDKVLLLE